MQAVLQLLGAVEEEALFRLCDLVVDQDTAGALTFVEELAAQGQDLGRLVLDLLEHLRALMLVQHMGEVPDSLPLTDETRERLAAQANQLGQATVVRLIDLLAVAVEDMRQGGDPRLPLELALVKVTRPAADMSREALAFRLDQLERGHNAPVPGTVPETAPEATAPPRATRCRARATAGGVAAQRPRRREREVDPDRVDARRGASRRARRTTRSRSSSRRTRRSTASSRRNRRTRRCFEIRSTS